MPVTLYHVPPSFYSQIARLVLVEKGVRFETKLAAAGPPLFETYAPWYIRLNPGGTVPTLVHDQLVVPDSREILGHVDTAFPGPSLTPAEPEARARMNRWIDRLYEVSIRELTYGSESMARTGARINRMRIARLAKLAAAHPDLREVYEAKRRDIEGFASAAADPASAEAKARQLGALLDELDHELSDHPFVAGPSYSLADVVATVTVARLSMLHQSPLDGRPALADWYRRVRARPSFVTANVWEHTHTGQLVGMIARKLGPRLLVAVGLLALLAWGLVALVGATDPSRPHHVFRRS